MHFLHMSQTLKNNKQKLENKEKQSLFVLAPVMKTA